MSHGQRRPAQLAERASRRPAAEDPRPEPRPRPDPQTPCALCNDQVRGDKHYKVGERAWHVPCFRCSACNVGLQSEAAAPFVLDDGFLACNSCAFLCQRCDQRVDEHGVKDGYSGTLGRLRSLATTPGQLDCPGLFFCHDCHHSIKNLRYVRTSQGIFCLGCQPATMSEAERVRRENERGSGMVVPLLVG